jgi:hypothetical protein
MRTLLNTMDFPEIKSFLTEATQDTIIVFQNRELEIEMEMFLTNIIKAKFKHSRYYTPSGVCMYIRHVGNIHDAYKLVGLEVGNIIVHEKVALPLDVFRYLETHIRFIKDVEHD